MKLTFMANGVFGRDDDPMAKMDTMSKRVAIEKEINPLLDKAVLDEDIRMTVKCMHLGLQFLFFYKTTQLASVVLHTGSYGNDKGLFEIMPFHAPDSWGDTVRGHLSFIECLFVVKEQLRLVKAIEGFKKT